MATFSERFGLLKAQGELDFVDVRLDRDTPLFVDPFALSMRQDRWGADAHALLLSYFQEVIDRIRRGRIDGARHLLSHLSEPNETRLGLSSGRPQGAGIGSYQADQLLEGLRQSQAVQTGLLSSLEECELMIPGISSDKISDLATNVLRGQLARYTAEQCDLHGVATRPVSVGPCFDGSTHDWVNGYLELPVADGHPVMLVPKAIVRFAPAYDHRQYYQHFALEYLQAEHLAAGSALVHTLRGGRRKVYKKELARVFPCSKEFLFEFSRQHPEVLAEYKEHLADLERRGVATEVETADEVGLAAALRAALGAVQPGSDQATTYHRLMIGILEFVFFPLLVGPKKEVEIHDGRKRIDILMENAAPSGIFHRLHDVRHLPCSYIPIECKNYTREIANPELDQISSRFSTNRGRAGLICCRAFDDRARFIERCRDTFRDGRGLVLPVDDATVARWLRLIEGGRRAELDGEIGQLVDEIWIS